MPRGPLLRGEDVGLRTWEIRRNQERNEARRVLQKMFAAHPLLAQPEGEANWQKLIGHYMTRARNGAIDLEALGSEDDKVVPINGNHSKPALDVSKLTRAQRVIKFIETYCFCPEGKHVGQPMVLSDFEKSFII